MRLHEAPLLTVIVPVFNEAATIAELLRRVLAAPYPKQVIVVDDGSSDGTVEVLEAWQGHREVESLAHSKNRGKGAAIRTALDNARGRFTIIQDADLEYDPQDYPDLIEPLLSGDAQVVYGSRTLNGHWAHGQRWNLFALGVRVLNVCLRLLYGARVTDEATCYKAFPTPTLKAMGLQCERFEFCPEVTAKACRLGLKILEVPIHYEPRSVRQGKKIRWSDGWKACGPSGGIGTGVATLDARSKRPGLHCLARQRRMKGRVVFNRSRPGNVPVILSAAKDLALVLIRPRSFAALRMTFAPRTVTVVWGL